MSLAGDEEAGCDRDLQSSQRCPAGATVSWPNTEESQFALRYQGLQRWIHVLVAAPRLQVLVDALEINGRLILGLRFFGKSCYRHGCLVARGVGGGEGGRGTLGGFRGEVGEARSQKQALPCCSCNFANMNGRGKESKML